MSVVVIGILGVVASYLLFRDPNVITGFGFGASSSRFCPRGGGIYTKAADVLRTWWARWRREFRGRSHAIPRSSRTTGGKRGRHRGMGRISSCPTKLVIAAMAIGPRGLRDRGVAYPLLSCRPGILSPCSAPSSFGSRSGAIPRWRSHGDHLRGGFHGPRVLLLTAVFFDGDNTRSSSPWWGSALGRAHRLRDGDLHLRVVQIREEIAMPPRGRCQNILSGSVWGMKSP